MKEKTIIFFDGICNLCDSFVNFVYQKDSRKQFFYAPLQGQTARELLATEDRTDLKYIVLFCKGRIFRGSQAIQEVFCRFIPAGPGFLKEFQAGFFMESLQKDATGSLEKRRGFMNLP